MLATGTLTSLQESHGGAFSVRAVRSEGTSKDEVERMVKERFEGRVREYEDRNGQVYFALPHEKRELGAIMRVMEELKGDVIEEKEGGAGSGAGAGGAGGSAAQEKGIQAVVSDYTITGPTLEEVFMNVAREAGAAGGV